MSAVHSNASRIRTTALERLTNSLAAHCPEAPANFAAELEAAVVGSHPAPPAYRERLLALLSNLPAVGPDAVSIGAARLATIPVSQMVSIAAAQKAEERASERARSNLIKGGDGLSASCRRCARTVRSKLNSNRFDVEDELLGQQFQNNYDDFCTCVRRWRDEGMRGRSAARRQRRRQLNRKRRREEGVALPEDEGSNTSSDSSTIIRTDESDWTLASASGGSDSE